MDKMKKSAILILMLFILGAGECLAQTSYVSDELMLPLRRGQSEKYLILKMLKAGTPVEVIAEHEQYFQVRTQDGTEGFVLKQYLTTELPKPLVIARLEKENARLKERVSELESRHSAVQSQFASVQQSQAAGEGMLAERDKELEELRRQHQELQEKSRNVVTISAERDRLQTANSELTAEVTALRQEREKVLYSGAIKWFLAGGGVLLAGWLIGRSSKKRKGYSF